MIRFYHGYQSSNQTNKFTEIECENKSAVTVDYEALSYAEVEALYSAQIENEKPEILVGHSLGGYWALKMSAKYEIPAVVLNPALYPEISLPHLNYETITQAELENRVPKYAYVELGDEVIDVPRTVTALKPVAYMMLNVNGHHRIERMDLVNELITYAMNTYMVS